MDAPGAAWAPVIRPAGLRLLRTFLRKLATAASVQRGMRAFLLFSYDEHFCVIGWTHLHVTLYERMYIC